MEWGSGSRRKEGRMVKREGEKSEEAKKGSREKKHDG